LGWSFCQIHKCNLTSFSSLRLLFLFLVSNLVKPVSFISACRLSAIPHAVEKSRTAKIESVALSETYSSVTRLKVSKVRSEGWAAGLKTTELPVGINPGTLGDTVTSGSRLALPQSNLDRSTMHKWSNDPRAVHKLVTYSVTMLSGTLGAIPLRVSRERSLSPPILSLSFSFRLPLSSHETEDVSCSYIPASKSFRVSGATVKNIQNQLCPRPRCGAFAKGMKAVSIYVQSAANSRCSFRDLFIALHGEDPLRQFLMDLTGFFVNCRRARKYGGDELF